MNPAAQLVEAVRRRGADDGSAMSDGLYPIRTRHDLRTALVLVASAANAEAVAEHILVRAAAIGAEDMLPSPDDSLIASLAIDIEGPPADWFQKPDVAEGLGPLTVTDEGRIFGRVATWGTCHIGNPAGAGVCVQAPRSRSNYSMFHLGVRRSAEGDDIPVGTLTLDTGHAGTQLSAHAAASHYDHTGTAVADVRCGEDEHGIWYAGALRPGLTHRQMTALRGAKVSGDWRRGEMVAALLVNVPGFPIPRPEAMLAASGEEAEPLALVAAGIVLDDCDDCEPDDTEYAIQIRVLSAAADGIEGLAALAASVGTWEESKHPRHPGGSQKGGEFAFKGEGEFEGMSDEQLRDEMASRDAAARAVPVKETSKWLDLQSKMRDAERELVRRRVLRITPTDEVMAQMDAIDLDRMRDSGFVGVSNVRKLEDGTWEVFERDRHSSSTTYPKFQGTKDEVAAYAQEAYDSSRDQAIRSARAQADATVDWQPGKRPITSGQAFSSVPNEWAVENGYAEWADYPHKAYGGYGYGGQSVGTVPTIRWKPDTNPEAVLFHFIGGHRAPANLVPGDPGYEQWTYMTKAGERPTNKAGREEAARRLTTVSAALTACGFVVAD